MASFAERFRMLRESRGWTQDDVAEKLGVSRPTIAGYESESKGRIPREETLIKIAELFGCTIDYLLGRTDDPTPPPKDDDIGPEPNRNPLGIELTPEQVELLREMRDDPEVLGMFRDFANSTEDERRMMLEIWETIRRRKGGK
ncbi:MAG: helix-turn-helix domain-containing protein [Alicyclobacillus sp.]|nr:helix-turn-helix domain-containing protein [Alicyclobacillus sp.]